MTEEGQGPFPIVRQVVLDAPDARALAEFYRQLIGYTYRAGDEPPPGGQADEKGRDWLVLCAPGGVATGGVARIAFQQVNQLLPSTWPRDEIPQQLHLDLTVSTREDLNLHHQRALHLGARLVLDSSDDEEEPLRVYADLAGHPFCIFVAPS
jgi:Glyoxalase-like domain